MECALFVCYRAEQELELASLKLLKLKIVIFESLLLLLLPVESFGFEDGITSQSCLC
ncbi:hypothetical protein AAZX31_10G282800 [Glycine max]